MSHKSMLTVQVSGVWAPALPTRPGKGKRCVRGWDLLRLALFYLLGTDTGLLCLCHVSLCVCVCVPYFSVCDMKE